MNVNNNEAVRILVGEEKLVDKAERLFPDNPSLQTKWLLAVEYLVRKSEPGWVTYWDKSKKRHIVGGQHLEKLFGM